MKNNKRLKKILFSCIALLLVAASGGGIWYYLTQQNVQPVFVYEFNYIGMTEYWGDMKESYGPIRTDKIQTVYLSDTQTVTEVLVAPGDTVKKGDILMTFDTTLSDLALEKKRLEVEKLKLQLEDAKERLWEINCMVPMVIYEPEPEPETTGPEEENLGIPLNGDYLLHDNQDFDGSTQETALICWVNGTKEIDDALFEELRLKAEEFQNNNAKKKAEEEAAQQATAPETAPEGTQPAPTAPTEPEPIVVTSFHVIFKVTESNMSLGQTQEWQGILATQIPGTTAYTFRFFDASGIVDPSIIDPPEEENKGPYIEYNSGYTYSQIAQMRSDQEKTIQDLEFTVKMTEADYKIMLTEVSDGNVYAQIDGTVISLLTEEEAKMTMQPFLKVSGGGGFYVDGSISELDKDSLVIGQEVTINDWYSGMVHTGIVESIGDFPTGEENWNGMNNPNVSYYPFTVFVDGEADFQAGSYVSIQYTLDDQVQSGIYLENPFIRTEQGRSYVYVMGADGLLEKRYVVTGKSLWGSYTEILEGITENDLIAFPYGKNVKEGAPAQQGDMSDLYGY